MENTEKELTKSGALGRSLSRNRKEILADRADNIYEDLEVTFKRNVEDLERKISKLKRDRNNMYDFSPTNTQSLVLANNVIAEDVLDRDMKISVEIRQLSIELEIATDRYDYLFKSEE